MNWKKTLLGLAVATILSSGSLLAQMPPPPPGPPGEGPPIQLTDDQKTRMKALHDTLRKQMEADRQTFETELKSILNKQQLAIVQEDDQRKAAFKQGEVKARAMLKQSGQPVPPESPDFGMDFAPPPALRGLHDGPPPMPM
ncbi:MAG: hypothetical protein ACYCW6_19870, partial [Candidatus Xenobia bacterium]